MWTPDNTDAAMGYAVRSIRATSFDDYLDQLEAAYRAEMGVDLGDEDVQRALSVHPAQMATMEDAQAREVA